jgi:hypothetical protein
MSVHLKKCLIREWSPDKSFQFGESILIAVIHFAVTLGSSIMSIAHVLKTV